MNFSPVGSNGSGTSSDVEPVYIACAAGKKAPSGPDRPLRAAVAAVKFVAPKFATSPIELSVKTCATDSSSGGVVSGSLILNTQPCVESVIVSVQIELVTLTEAAIWSPGATGYCAIGNST